MRNEKYRFSDLAGLLVWGLFALCLLLVLLTGAGVCRDLIQQGEQTHRSRTGIGYIATRVQQGQDVSVESFGGIRALALRESIDGECYVTYVYCREGWLWELTCPEGAGVEPEDGQRLLEAETLSLSLEDGLLKAELDDRTIWFTLRSGRRAEP